MALFFVTLVERESLDPQEARAMVGIRAKSLSWLAAGVDSGRLRYAFRDELNTTSYLVVEASSHTQLHRLLDPDPLISHCMVSVEPVLRTVDMVRELVDYLDTEQDRSQLTGEDWEELEGHGTKAIDDDALYYLAVKKVRPFSPLLPLKQQDEIHRNTLIAQSAHLDERELLDLNPVGKPIGILVMQAASRDEVEAHVASCEVYVDTIVSYTRLLTIKQAINHNEVEGSKYFVGCIRREA